MSVVAFPSYASRVAHPRMIDTGLRLARGGREIAVLMCSACQNGGSSEFADVPVSPKARCGQCKAEYAVIAWEQAEEWGFLDVPEGAITIAIDAFLNQIAPRHE